MVVLKSRKSINSQTQKHRDTLLTERVVKTEGLYFAGFPLTGTCFYYPVVLRITYGHNHANSPKINAHFITPSNGLFLMYSGEKFTVFIQNCTINNEKIYGPSNAK
jgi:hypothetical protein